MKYIINYNDQGRILGFVESDTGNNIEVSNSIWVEGQIYNKIIVDGENISFDKIDWRSEDEIAKENISISNAEAISSLNSSDWKVIRELERLLLAGTELNLEREVLRGTVI